MWEMKPSFDDAQTCY